MKVPKQITKNTHFCQKKSHQLHQMFIIVKFYWISYLLPDIRFQSAAVNKRKVKEWYPLQLWHYRFQGQIKPLCVCMQRRLSYGSRVISSCSKYLNFFSLQENKCVYMIIIIILHHISYICLCLQYLIMSQIAALFSYSFTQWFMNALSALPIFQ